MSNSAGGGGSVLDPLGAGGSFRALEQVDNVLDAVPWPVAATRLAEGGTAVFTRGISEPAPEGRRFEVVLV